MGGRLASCGTSHSSLTHWRPFHHTAPHCLPVEHFPTYDGPALISLPRRGKLRVMQLTGQKPCEGRCVRGTDMWYGWRMRRVTTPLCAHMVHPQNRYPRRRSDPLERRGN